MVSEKKMNLKRRWLTGLLIPAVALAIVGFVTFNKGTNNVKAESVGSPYIHECRISNRSYINEWCSCTSWLSVERVTRKSE